MPDEFIALDEAVELTGINVNQILRGGLDKKYWFYHYSALGWVKVPWGVVVDLYNGRQNIKTPFYTERNGKWTRTVAKAVDPAGKVTKTTSEIEWNLNLLHLRSEDLKDDIHKKNFGEFWKKSITDARTAFRHRMTNYTDRNIKIIEQLETQNPFQEEHDKIHEDKGKLITKWDNIVKYMKEEVGVSVDKKTLFRWNDMLNPKPIKTRVGRIVSAYENDLRKMPDRVAEHQKRKKREKREKIASLKSNT